jgi:peptidoglycan-N-acetylglucosamine deacetylase
MFYLVKTPNWLQWLWPNYLWKMKESGKTIFLSFDDGPHPIHTPFVLDELKKYNAKATFFCIGKNVVQYPVVYRRIIDEGHAVGNHTFNHLKGRKCKDETYMKDIADAANFIDSKLFRPPYGSIKLFQAKLLTQNKYPYKIVMWTVLSGDFDKKLSKESCLENVLFKTGAGDIVVFHDSDKAAKKMRYALPALLKNLFERGYGFEKIKQF